ncbi:MAG: response regulator [Nitrospirae bacterium]|nr:response regulator [Nitrospirota bacterium]
MDFKRKKILIADDSRTHLVYMAIILKRMGFTVIPAENGLEALKLVKLTEPDIVMLDIIMEGMDGSSLLHYIKGNEETSHIPVIMASHDGSDETRERCRNAGCSAFLLKPVRIDRLHEILEELVFSSWGAKRRHVRVSFCRKVQVTTGGMSQELYAETLSEGGMYVRKREPSPVGSEVEVALPLDAGGPIRLRGVVAYTKGLFGGVFEYPPGMAIQFKEVRDFEVASLRHYVEKVLAQDIFESQEEIVIEPLQSIQ